MQRVVSKSRGNIDLRTISENATAFNLCRPPMKPFKPPSFVGALSIRSDAKDGHEFDQPAPKRRKVDNTNDTLQAIGRRTQFPPASRSLGADEATNSKTQAIAEPYTDQNQAAHVVYYNVLWRKPTAKKHKTWDGDGILRVTAGVGYLKDNDSGRDIGRTACPRPLLPESRLSIGGKEVEVDTVIPPAEALELKACPQSISVSRANLQQRTALKEIKKSVATANSPRQPIPFAAETEQPTSTSQKVSASMNSFATQQRFKNPIIDQSGLAQVPRVVPTPRHDPNAEGALVMARPINMPSDKQVVDVVVDPLLSKSLRKHQQEGVKFLYECIMGLRNFNGNGAILADEMGLGKTLQTIAVIWTLLKQNPVYGDPPVLRKVIIVCPVTLINNWRKEFRKWLGLDRIGVYVADNSKTRITDFTHGKTYNVMIIGYEKLRKLAEELQKGHGVDLIVADEGHRLKTAQNKAGVAMKSFLTTRRVILSGTPIQNDLSEFYSMVDFVNPGILGGIKRFVKNFEDPIVRSRQPEATKDEIEKGQARSEELSEITGPFMLRRTADILSKYLPPKTEHILMCQPTKAQGKVYRAILTSPIFQLALSNSETYLQLITILKKVCNSPKLLSVDPAADLEKNVLVRELASSIPANLLQNAASAKLRVLDQLLSTLRSMTTEKVVLVSNFTSTLDLLSSLLESLSMRYLRLDGTTPVGKRQELVDLFNRTPANDYFAFLLSAKAGGMGLNLIGASRLVLFDVDWNPAIDAQAMARIHRDGQKRPCVIYRLLMAGSLDEKIWQRQVTKIGLANSVMEQKAGVSSFTRDELRDLFRLDDGATLCQTHELLKCTCQGRGAPDSGISTPTTPELDNPGDGADSEFKEPSDNDEPPGLGKLISAVEVDIKTQEEQIRKLAMARRRHGAKDGAQMQSLMSYAHIDATQFAQRTEDETDALVHDDVLLDVLKNEENRIVFLFSKTTGG